MRKNISKLFLYSLLCCGLSVVPTGCDNHMKGNRNDDTLIKHIEDSYGKKVKNETERIFYINDQGCGRCVNSYSDFVLNYVDDAKSMVIINSKGLNVDMDKFREKAFLYPDHILLAYDPKKTNKHLPDLCIIYITKRRVDSIFEVNSGNIHSLLQYAKSKIQ